MEDENPYLKGMKKSDALFLARKRDRELNWKQSHEKYPFLSPSGDYDSDGVPNAKDCRPMNPQKHGILSAISGAVGGLLTTKNKSIRTSGERMQEVKRRWSEGMQKGRQYKNVGRDYKDLENAIKRGKIMREARQAYSQERLKQLKGGVKSAIYSTPGLRVFRPMTDPRTGQPIPRTGIRERIQQQRYLTQTGKISPVQRRKVLAAKRVMRVMFPMIPAAATTAVYEYQSKKGQGGRRGRPKGSVKYPGGVYAWRKEQRRIRAIQRLSQQQQMYQQALQTRAPQRHYPQQPFQYVQEESQVPYAPEETQGGYQMPQEYIPPLEYTQEPQKQPIGRVFKSYGGSPYPPVSSEPLAPTHQTIPQGYVEMVDSFTGKKILKRLPPPEKWATGER